MYPAIHIGPYTYYTFGIMVGLAVCAGTYAASLYFKRHGLPVNMTAWFLAIIPIGFFAARVDDTFVNAFRSSFHITWSEYVAQLSSGGLTYYGGMVVSLLAFIVFTCVNRLPMLRTLDSLFCLGLAFAIGRIGCFLSGDGDYGVASSLPWAMSFPHGDVPTLVRVHPTMLYTTLYELIVFAALWKLSSPRRPRTLRPGTLLGLYLVLTSAGRFAVELLSRNRPILLHMTEAQLVSVGLVCAGVALLITTLFRPTVPASDSPQHGTLRSEPSPAPADLQAAIPR